MPADADLIAGGLLLELKTNLGRKRGTTRVSELDVETVRQLVGYVLHDTDDHYEITDVAIYQARYGTLATWPLQEFLDRLAGRPIDVATQREVHAKILGLGGRLDAVRWR